ncbi:MAG: alkaline phosphatase D family protein [Lacipirellulaceae bacterium]
MFYADPFRRSVRLEGGISRRLVLAYGAALAAVPTLGRGARAAAGVSFPDFPFTLGVASGDPDSSSVVLWTRLAPKPLDPNGGMGTDAVEVEWELADDEAMTRVVASGRELATPQLGHAVHVEPHGLKPDRWYWYRFRAGDAESPIGKTRTMPARDASPDRLRFAFTSCQHYETGYYTAYEQMKRDDVDMVFHLGDYIYEGAGQEGQVRKHVGGEIRSLGDYRVRLAQYRVDPLLHGMHAQCPWMVTWDDHEVDNNYADAVSEESGVDPVDFLLRRANAYQAYYEAMPLRRRSLPTGPGMNLYRSVSFGRLAELLVLDTRQHRTDQPNGDRKSPLNDAARDPKASLLGADQRGWVERSLVGSTATWNVLAQQVMMGIVGFPDGRGGLAYSMDQWPGYLHEREHLLRFCEERRVPNPVVLTGDIHTNWVNDLRLDDQRPGQPVLATEFVCTSLSSGGNGTERPQGLEAIMEANPGVRFHNAERGYCLATLTPGSWRTDFVVVDDVQKPGGKAVVRASFEVEAGRPGARSVGA